MLLRFPHNFWSLGWVMSTHGGTDELSFRAVGWQRGKTMTPNDVKSFRDVRLVPLFTSITLFRFHEHIFNKNRILSHSHSLSSVFRLHEYTREKTFPIHIPTAPTTTSNARNLDITTTPSFQQHSRYNNTQQCTKPRYNNSTRCIWPQYNNTPPPPPPPHVTYWRLMTPQLAYPPPARLHN